MFDESAAHKITFVLVFGFLWWSSEPRWQRDRVQQCTDGSRHLCHPETKLGATQMLFWQFQNCRINFVLSLNLKGGASIWLQRRNMFSKRHHFQSEVSQKYHISYRTSPTWVTQNMISGQFCTVQESLAMFYWYIRIPSGSIWESQIPNCHFSLAELCSRTSIGLTGITGITLNVPSLFLQL